MDINASIVDQRLEKVVDAIRVRAAEELGISEPVRLKSLAFVYLCVETILDLEEASTFDCLTEGGGDFGVDAIHISEEHDGEFTISLFQGKYKQKLDGSSAFPENGIKALIDAINYLFDPAAKVESINQRLLAKVEEARSLIRDGYIPQVRALACNNGLSWNESAQEAMERAGLGEQVTWEHVSPERLVKILQASRPVKDTLQLAGKAIVEDMNFSRILVGRIAVGEIANLIARHGERLLERNIRRYLGLQGNRVNEGIRKTLEDDTEKNNFYFYNNGITMTCDSFTYNALQSGDYQLRVENLQIINGGQTCMTIFKTLQGLQLDLFPTDAYVLLRLYQLPLESEDLVRKVTYATNSQNPVDLRDLRSNEDLQKRLETDLEQLGYVYRRKRSSAGARVTDITSGVAAEAILSVWRKKPHQAKFFTREHFGKLYEQIFTERLNGAQVVLAVLIYRIAENRRKRPELTDPDFVRYASCFIAMQMGERLLRDLGLGISEISHRNLGEAVALLEQNRDAYFVAAAEDIAQALRRLYGDRKISLQQLSATFRRGDLIEQL